MSIVVNGSELVSRTGVSGGADAGQQQEVGPEERSMVLALSHVTPQQAAGSFITCRTIRGKRKTSTNSNLRSSSA